jgi:16S rRNA (uracil1498-N3)-methyltransferase
LFGDGFEHSYRIEDIDKKSATLVEIAKTPSRMQSRECGLALALIKKDNFELVLSKCTELGVTDLYPFISERSIQKMYGEERLHKILVEAAEQSGWGRVPTLHSVQKFEDMVQNNNCVIYDMTGEASTDFDTRIICIGPEGGYSEHELQLAKDFGTKIRKMGEGILRAETAAIVAASLRLLS